MANNFDRMMQLVDEVFASKNDPEQISVTEEDREKLLKIHYSSMSQQANEDGPFAWLIIIPTTNEIMRQFISKQITEQQLLDLTPLDTQYESIYLCSVLLLPEFRGKSIAKRMTMDAIKSIQKEHSINALFYWRFSSEGERLANSIAKLLELPLVKRID